MANYSVISDVSNAIVKILRENMVPEIILNSDAIGLCNPTDKGDIILGINLYDIKESTEVFTSGMKNIGMGKQKYPSSYMDLYYMITAFSSSDVKFRATEEQRILGKTIQVLRDNSIITADMMNSASAMTADTFIEMLRLEQDEKMKLWSVPNVAYKMSLFYKVHPIEIESERVREVHRVTDVDWTVKESK